MLKRRVLRQVQGILADRQIPALHPEVGGGQLLVRPPGPKCQSAAILVSVEECEGRMVVALCANLLENVVVSGDQRTVLLEVINRLNGHALFGRLWFDEPAAIIRFEHAVPADELDDEELVWPLLHLNVLADELDDELLAIVTSGRRAHDFLALAAELERSTNVESELNALMPPPIP